jgi:hypothetical protein
MLYVLRSCVGLSRISSQDKQDGAQSNDELVNAGSSKSGHAIMRARARLISLIGDELISDEPVAVVELVKNAYDADAKKCERCVFGPKHPGSGHANGRR